MATVATGTRLVLHAPDRPVALRVLRESPVSGEWAIPVLAPAGPGLEGLAGTVDVPTERGMLTLHAHLAVSDGVLCLVPGSGVPLLVQRRQDVRAEVRLPLQAVTEQEVKLHPVGPDPVQPSLAGTTVSLSAGGLGLRAGDGLELPDRAGRLYAELALPDGRLVPVILGVLEAGTAGLRARFDRIDPVDRERLVRLVFEQQRRELAARKRLADAWPAWR